MTKRRLRAAVLGAWAVAAGTLAAASGSGPATTTTTTGSAASDTVTDCVSLLPVRPTGGRGLCYTPHQYRVTYGIQSLLDRKIDGSGETLTIVSPAPSASASEPPSVNEPPPATDIRQDLEAFDSEFGLPAARIQVVTTLAGSASPWQATSEEVSDFEIAHTVAPGATLRVVLLPSDVLETSTNATADMVAALRLAVSGTDVASISWSLGEHYFTRAQVVEMHSILLRAAARHVTVDASSGDHGASSDPWWGMPDKEVSLPASDPLVLAVGGTALTANRSTGAYIGETAMGHGAGRPPGAPIGGSEAASVTGTLVPPTRIGYPGSQRPGACPTWPAPVTGASRSSSPAAAGRGSSRSAGPAPPPRCGGDSWRWPTSTPVTTSASSTPPSTASLATLATTRPSTTLRPVTTP